MIKEVWIKVPEYDHLTDEQNELFTSLYQVSNHGRLWSNNTGNFKVPSTQTEGYKILCWAIPKRMGVGLKNQRSIAYRVHRMVAKGFIDNPYNKPDVNHIDGVKSNNNLNNLEWCTSKENAQHSKHKLKSACYNEGHKSIYSKADEKTRRFVIDNYKQGDRQFGTRALGRMFNVDHATIIKYIKDGVC